jgi:hypothetical protein
MTLVLLLTPPLAEYVMYVTVTSNIKQPHTNHGSTHPVFPTRRSVSTVLFFDCALFSLPCFFSIVAFLLGELGAVADRRAVVLSLDEVIFGMN